MKCYLNIGVLVAILLSAQGLWGVDKPTISGYVKSAVSGEALIGAEVVNLNNRNEGTLTNEYGLFSLTSVGAMDSILISYLGYASQKIIITAENHILTVMMEPQALQTNDILIQSMQADHNVASTESGRVRLDIETIKKLPVLFGEVDVLKTVTLVPGIKQGVEGSTGFYVRGGSPDQNLILLDDAVLYNPSHLASFFSIFSGDAVKNVEVIKGGIPTQYGGRLSSVVNVTMKEGNNQKFTGSAGIGLLCTRLTLEGPIKKGKGSFMISGRRSFIDALTLFLPKNFKGNTYYFYDLNLKANYILGKKDRLYISGYFGQDVLKFKIPTGTGVKVLVEYGNQLGALRWNHLFNEKLFVNTTLSYNRYHINYDSQLGVNTLKILSGLEDYSLRHDYQYFPISRVSVRFGAQYNYHIFRPGVSNSNQSGVDAEIEIPRQFAHEGAAYASADYEINDKLALYAGLRYSVFNLVGPYKKELFDSLGAPTGAYIQYGKGESIAFYHGLEPRATLRYKTSNTSSVKLSYNRTFQYVQLASTSSSVIPMELWVPASQRAKPQIGDQVTLGYFRNFKQNKYEASAEVYFKNMQNQIEIDPRQPIVFNTNVERYMLFGKGMSYGLELFLKRNIGKATGWIGYTYAHSLRRFSDLNGGDWFPSRYDRRHDFSAVFTYKFNEKWTGSFLWMFSSGNPITLPVNRFNYVFGMDGQTPNSTLLDIYGKINNVRAPAYHRADVTFTYTPAKKRKYERYWTFGVYNAYNRLNPFFIYPEIDPETGKTVVKKLAIFPAIPSVTWNIKF